MIIRPALPGPTHSPNFLQCLQAKGSGYRTWGWKCFSVPLVEALRDTGKFLSRCIVLSMIESLPQAIPTDFFQILSATWVDVVTLTFPKGRPRTDTSESPPHKLPRRRPCRLTNSFCLPRSWPLLIVSTMMSRLRILIFLEDIRSFIFLTADILPILTLHSYYFS